jgi:hypothetical protein
MRGSLGTALGNDGQATARGGGFESGAPFAQGAPGSAPQIVIKTEIRQRFVADRMG